MEKVKRVPLSNFGCQHVVMKNKLGRLSLVVILKMVVLAVDQVGS